MKNYIHIYWTASNLEEARKICQVLVEKKLVACANIIPEIESIFLWEGKIETQKEAKVIFKTRDEKFESVKEIILKLSEYEVPEVLKIEISGGHTAYLKWIDEVLMIST